METLSLIKPLEGEILGPDSPFSENRTVLKKEWSPIVESAKAINIVSVDSHEMAVGHGKLLQQSTKNLEEFYKPIKKQIDALKKIVLDAEKADTTAITSVKEALGLKVQAWNKEQDRILAEAMRIAAQQARKEAEERRIAEAIAAEGDGDKEEAERILNETPLSAPSIVQTTRVKRSGEVEKTTWTAQVDNLLDLIKAVAGGEVPVFAVMANQPWLNSQASDYREGLSYPGVSVHSSTKTHFRS